MTTSRSPSVCSSSGRVWDSDSSSESDFSEDDSIWEKMWPRHFPGFLFLKAMGDLRWLELDSDLSNATYDVVLHNAMASVPLLETLGDDIVRTKGLGIDYVGRLRHLGPGDKDYSDRFRDLVAKIRPRLEPDTGLWATKNDVRLDIGSFTGNCCPQYLPEDRIEGQQLSKVKTLRNAVRIKKLYELDFEAQDVYVVLLLCKPAAAELANFRTLAREVRKDLLKERPPRRWDELLEMRRSVGLNFQGTVDGMERAGQVNTPAKKVIDLIWNDLGLSELWSDQIKVLEYRLRLAIRRFSALGAI
ncbi:uncharacterized protein B0H64DRAFT_93629 [Chaetomium fimeti]|uniref:Uncharacterized protein n=1 Tax=Chaetomium fimeti TaxID=1854472 RepID=A0AAE0LVL2_9PEZI|nr:hypothetical protein B0H64DRAFT_93629 [Chaetomium fimeti]